MYVHIPTILKKSKNVLNKSHRVVNSIKHIKEKLLKQFKLKKALKDFKIGCVSVFFDFQL